tara:strand:+ start:2868 stop:4442 length:1575 start_codon:yes stop_codon:yes gene_type:complete
MVDITPLGGRGISVNPEGTDYPFVDPDDDVRGVLADAFVAHEVRTAVLPLRLVKMTNFDAALPCSSESSESSESTSSSAAVDRADVLITDDVGQIICDTSLLTDAHYRQTDFGTRFRIHEWIQEDDTVGGQRAFVCRVVQHTAFEDEEDVHCIPNVLTPTSNVLDERVSQLLPKRIRSITVNTVKLRERIRITNGYNTRLFQGSDTRTTTAAAIPTSVLPSPRFPFQDSAKILRNKQRVTISANPGDGLGVFPGCPELDVILRRINGVSPQGRVHADGTPYANAGNFLLGAEKCYYVRQPTSLINNKAIPSNATLRVGNDCGPCCECVEFANTYKAMKRLWDRFKTLGSRSEAVRNMYQDNMDRWTSQKSCREGRPLRLAMDQSFGSDVLIVSTAGAICNSSDECITNVQLHVCFSCPETGDSLADSSSVTEPTVGPLVCNSSISSSGGGGSRTPYQPEGEWPCYTFNWNEVDPGHAVNFRMQMRFECQELCSPLRATLTATINGEVIDQQLHHNLDVECEECE